MPDHGAEPRGVGPLPPPTPPSSRPAWLLVLSSLTLVYGGLLLVSGLTALRDPVSAARLPVGQPLAPEQEAIGRRLSEAGTRVIQIHEGGIRKRAVAALIVALVMLYAAAATLSRDRHGRTVTLLAAWFGIAYQIGTLPIVIPIARDYAVAAAPLLAELVEIEGKRAKQTGAEAAAGGEAAKPESMAKSMESLFVGIPVMVAGLGVGVSFLLIVFFGGRRGRLLYGLGPAPPPR
jgi:hypothetical protein